MWNQSIQRDCEHFQPFPWWCSVCFCFLFFPLHAHWNQTVADITLSSSRFHYDEMKWEWVEESAEQNKRMWIWMKKKYMRERGANEHTWLYITDEVDKKKKRSRVKEQKNALKKKKILYAKYDWEVVLWNRSRRRINFILQWWLNTQHINWTLKMRMQSFKRTHKYLYASICVNVS